MARAKHIIRIFSLLSAVIFSVFSTEISAQTIYPAYVHTVLIPPYSLYLDDYATGMRERIMVTLYNRDLSIPYMSVRLKLTVKSNGFSLTTNNYAAIPVINVEPNAPYRLSQQELMDYFDIRNLTVSGMGTAAWQRERKLPEGVIEFCFEMLDNNTGRKLSAPGCGIAYITTQKPSLLNLPANNEIVPYTDPLNKLFQWTPHQGGLNVEYDFILKQALDSRVRPEAAWAYSPEIYRETVRSTSLLYGVTMPALMPGNKYMWAVQAVAKDGMDNIRVFENNGLSEIRTFEIEDYCEQPTDITVIPGSEAINIEWTASPEQLEFTVKYRKINIADAYWFEEKTSESSVTLTGIIPGDTIEYSIGTVCRHGAEPVFGQTDTVSLPLLSSNPNCGKYPEIDKSNRELLMDISPGDMFYSGDFPVYVMSLTSRTNGVFRGTGYTLLPGIFADAKLRVTLENVQINTDRLMIGGEVVGVYDTTRSQIFNLDNIFEGGEMFGKVNLGTATTDITVDFVIPPDADFVFDATTNIITVGNAGTIDVSQIAAEREEVFPLTVKDKEGNIYNIEQDANGNLKATKTGRESVPIPEGAVDYKKPASDKATVTFRKSGKYAFDTWISQYGSASLIREKYEQIGNDYYVPFKLIPPGRTDEIEAVIVIKKQEEIDPEKVVFKTPKGTVFEHKYRNKTYTVSLTGGESGDGQEIYALYPDGDKYLNLGKLIVVSYPERTYNLTAVAVNGVSINTNDLSKTLNEIYNPMGIIWKVKSETYDYTGSTTFMEKGSGLLDAYPAAMKTFHNTYSADRTIDEKTAYLFFFDQYGAGGAKNRDADGFMPRGQQFGYMFTKGFSNKTVMYTAAAHELGHGVFVLKHTFDNDYQIPKGSTDNLMDYADNATHIAKWQWDLMHDPGVVMRVFERDKDAMKKGTHILETEYLIHDGIIKSDTELENGLYKLHKSKAKIIKTLLSTKTIEKFLKEISASSVLNNLIFETGQGSGGKASTVVGFLVPQIREHKEGFGFRYIKDMKTESENSYKESKLCINIFYSSQLYSDHDLAHEMLIHNLRSFNEINKIDFKNLSKTEAIAKLEEIQNYAYYKDSDGGNREHYEFITGEKKEMTQYTIERLEQMTTVYEKLSYLCMYILEIKKYFDIIEYPDIIEKNGGYSAVMLKIKKYLEQDFANYKNYIFEPLNKLNIEGNNWPLDLENKDKSKTLWEIYIKK